jgi:hypothetical protein
MTPDAECHFGLLPRRQWRGFGRRQVHRRLEMMVAVQRNGVSFEVVMDWPDDVPFDDLDLCSVFANLLDNVIDAAAAISDPSLPKITIRSSDLNNMEHPPPRGIGRSLSGLSIVASAHLSVTEMK